MNEYEIKSGGRGEMGEGRSRDSEQNLPIAKWQSGSGLCKMHFLYNSAEICLALSARHISAF